MARRKIVVAMMMHETNTFSPAARATARTLRSSSPSLGDHRAVEREERGVV